MSSVNILILAGLFIIVGPDLCQPLDNRFQLFRFAEHHSLRHSSAPSALGKHKGEHSMESSRKRQHVLDQNNHHSLPRKVGLKDDPWQEPSKPDELPKRQPKKWTVEECERLCMRTEGYIVGDDGSKRYYISKPHLDKHDSNCGCEASKELLGFLKTKHINTEKFLEARKRDVKEGKNWLETHGAPVKMLTI
ncbi:unnamed protein product [Bemisia tabaci]|uniref:Uncharacterized protein n=1 Tax=Bemisia tabaci TaxID=7038 RepID=A0A9P0AJN6_BEMTA|nr:unnamed protein product [Bemisia tabaci]